MQIIFNDLHIKFSLRTHKKLHYKLFMFFLQDYLCFIFPIIVIFFLQFWIKGVNK
jgi:hypothetical protein